MNEELKNILTKVGALYLRYGIKSITMDDIARELGISKKTLYQFVDDKADLVEKVLIMQVEMRHDFIESFKTKNLNAIEEMLEVHKVVNKMLQNFNPTLDYDLKKYYPQLFEKIRLLSREHMMKSIVGNIEKGKNEGLYRKSLNSNVIAKLQIFRNEAICHYDVFSSEELNTPDTFSEIFFYHIRGIASDKGIKFLEQKLGKNLGE